MRDAENVEAAAAVEVIVVAVPYSNHAHALEAIRQTTSGKIVVDVVVPLVPPKVSVMHSRGLSRARSKGGPRCRRQGEANMSYQVFDKPFNDGVAPPIQRL